MNKTDQIMKWIVGVATAAALGLSGWSLSTTASTQARVSVVEERSDNTKERRGRIENKIDRLIERLTR